MANIPDYVEIPGRVKLKERVQGVGYCFGGFGVIFFFAEWYFEMLIAIFIFWFFMWIASKIRTRRKLKGGTIFYGD